MRHLCSSGVFNWSSHITLASSILQKFESHKHIKLSICWCGSDEMLHFKSSWTFKIHFLPKSSHREATYHIPLHTHSKHRQWWVGPTKGIEHRERTIIIHHSNCPQMIKIWLGWYYSGRCEYLETLLSAFLTLRPWGCKTFLARVRKWGIISPTFFGPKKFFCSLHQSIFWLIGFFADDVLRFAFILWGSLKRKESNFQSLLPQ